MKYARKYNTVLDASNNIENDYVEPFVALVKDEYEGQTYSIVAYNKFGRGNINVPVVDMGLGVGWAEYNLGASSPEESGDVYMWGDTYNRQGASENFGNYGFAQYFNGEYIMTKYNNDDNRYYLETQDDAAHAYYGALWRIPSTNDIYTLLDYSTVTSETLNNVECVKITSNITGNSIYFSKSYAFWTREVEGNDKFSAYAFGDGAIMASITDDYYDTTSDTYVDVRYIPRYKLCCVRPVVYEAALNGEGFWSILRYMKQDYVS